MKSIRLLAALLVATVPWNLAAETFRFTYQQGEQYRIVSTVDQEVWVNGVYSHAATILNRIAWGGWDTICW